MFRFFVKEKRGNSFLLSEETLKHIRVSRTTSKEFICVFEEEFYVCMLENNVAVIKNKINEFHEHDGEVIIAAGFIDTKRFEWLIQKTTELGATKIIPVLSENVSKKLPINIDKKLERWNQIALNASEQSFRNKQLIVEKPQTFDEILKLKIKNKFIAHEKNNNDVKMSFPTDSLFLVGPEGGFSEIEVKKASKNNFEIVSLGKRILRAETASIFILSRIN